MREEDIKLLNSIGLSKTESIVFLTLNRYYTCSAVEISKITEIHRPNIYDSLRRLKEKGLVIEIIGKKGKTYRALEPEKLKDYSKKQVDRVEDLVENLKKIPKKKVRTEEVMNVSEGLAVKKELKKAMDFNEEILISMHADCRIDCDFFRELNSERINKKIPMKVLISNAEEERIKRLEKMPFTKVKNIKYTASPNFILVLVGDTTFHLFSKEENKPYLIEIRQKDITEERKNRFAYAWENTRLFN